MTLHIYIWVHTVEKFCSNGHSLCRIHHSVIFIFSGWRSILILSILVQPSFLFPCKFSKLSNMQQVGCGLVWKIVYFNQTIIKKASTQLNILMDWLLITIINALECQCSFINIASYTRSRMSVPLLLILFLLLAVVSGIAGLWWFGKLSLRT